MLIQWTGCKTMKKNIYIFFKDIAMSCGFTPCWWLQRCYNTSRMFTDKMSKAMSQLYSAMCQGIFAKLICTGVLFRGVLQFILYFPKDQSVSIASLLITNFFTGS